MSIQKTPQGTFRARYRDLTGKQISKTFRHKADALVWERQGLLARDQGESPTIRTPNTVAQWANLWLANARSLAPGTVATYERDLNRYILPTIGDYRVSDVTTEHVDELLTELLERGLAASTVHRQYRTMNRMFRVAVERGKITTNPCEPVEPPRIPHREMKFLTIPQVELLADTVPDRYRAWVLVAAYGGLRWGEMLALRPEDVKDGVINVRAQLVKVDGEYVRMHPKSKAGRRKVPLPASVEEELGYHLDRYAGDTLFVNQHGRPMSHASFTGNVFKPALVKARLDREVRIHDLRHTAVAIAIQAGAHPKAIQRRLGHASIAITLDTYGHLMPDMESTLADDIETLRNVFIGLYDEAAAAGPDLRIV